MVHKPVLLGEVIESLNLKKGDTVVDGTLGAGGHSEEMLKKILPEGKLVAIDWDAKAIANFKERSDIPKKNLHLAQENYADIDKILRGLGVKTVDAIFVDLGFSSDQIEDAGRGFSFRLDGPLDMRYSPEKQKTTAAGVVNEYPQEDLERIFKDYGEERFAKKIAKAIAQTRKEKPIKTTTDLVETIRKAVPKNCQTSRLHFATRAFQAIRIETNQELKNLRTFLQSAVDNLASGGRLAIISFHSLEDRIVKNFFKKESRDCVCPPNYLQCVCNHKKRLKIITKKPIAPSGEEIRENPRARSAKLRVAERI